MGLLDAFVLGISIYLLIKGLIEMHKNGWF